MNCSNQNLFVMRRVASRRNSRATRGTRSYGGIDSEYSRDLSHSGSRGPPQLEMDAHSNIPRQTFLFLRNIEYSKEFLHHLHLIKNVWLKWAPVVYLNVVWLLAASSLPIYSLPVPSAGFVPKKVWNWGTLAIPTRSTTAEHKIYMRILYPGGVSSSTRVIDPNLHKRTPAYVTRGLFYNKNGYLLTIHADGTVDGTRDNASSFAKMEFHSIGTGLLMIMGVSTNRYLSISDAGILHGSKEPSLNSIFEEVQEENMFHSYISYKHKKDGWLIGLKKNGKAKRATATGVGQKSTQFLPTYHY